MIRKRVLRSIVAIAVLSTLVVSPVSAKTLEEKKAEAEGQVHNLQSQLTELMTKSNELEVKLTKKGEEIIQAEADLEDAKEKEEKQYEAMKLRIKYLYEDGDTATIEKIITSGSFAEMLEQVEYASTIHTYDRNELLEYQSTQKQIADLKTSLETEQAELKKTEAQYLKQQEELNDTLSSAEAKVADLDDQIQEAARAALEAQRRAEEEAAREAANNQPVINNSPQQEPSYNVSTGNVIVDRARSQMGKPYVWGATGPDAYDCSGLVGYALTGGYSRVGTTYTFLTWNRVSDPQPGDICVDVNHCGIYIGGGQMVHAPCDGIPVSIGPVQGSMIYVRP